MSPIDGRATVEVLGKPMRFASISVPFERLNVFALPANDDAVHVGGIHVCAAVGRETGNRLDELAIAHYENGDLMDLYVDALVVGEGVHWGGF